MMGRRSKKEMHHQPNNPTTDALPCCVALVPSPATHMQRQAWTCLWRMLLLEDIDHSGRSARGNEGENNDHT